MSNCILPANCVFGDHNSKTREPWLKPSDLNDDLAIIYGRVSTRRQAQEGDSLGLQILELIWFLRRGLIEILDTFRDEGLRGWHLQRPGLLNAIELAKQEHCPIVVLHKDRLFRPPLTTSSFSNFGVTFAVVNPLDEPEAEARRKACARSMEMKRDRGESLGGRPAYYNHRAMLIIDAMKNKGWTWKQIVDSLNEAGLTSANGKTWNRDKLRKFWKKWKPE